ncbi:MAG: hypothetical protein RCG15_02650 [Candidatus Rickettsia vulgarisii]
MELVDLYGPGTGEEKKELAYKLVVRKKIYQSRICFIKKSIR